MNTDHQRDYFMLIEVLLRCPRGEEAKILNTNRDLIDAGLVQAMAQGAKEWQRDSGNTPDSLLL